MKHVASLIALSALIACGGSAKPPASLGTATSAPPAEEEVAEPAPPPEPDPPPPPQWTASAALTPVKGAKVKPFTVELVQTDGEATTASVEAIAGLKLGGYQLVVHEGDACGKNAAGAGPIWADAGAGIALTATRGVAPSLAAATTDLALDGERTIIGRTLVLHADQRGRPGKALACGPIISGTAPDPDAAAVNIGE
ncbi:MAG: hypothetical protein JNK64_13600 [Myxococcales bacterium]|nr:hypothetical protein [Myxococcales bacterium]